MFECAFIYVAGGLDPSVVGGSVYQAWSSGGRYGSSDLEIKKVCVARTSPLSDTAIIEGTSLQATFGSMSGAIIPPGKTVYTDPVEMHVESFEKLSVTVYYQSFTPMSTGGLINAKSFIDPGDRTEAISFYAQSPLTITSGAIVYNTTPFLCGADTYGEGNSCVVMFGDSTLANDSSYYLAEKLNINGRKNVGVLQQAIIGIKNRMGKNAILKGTNFVEGATGKERNEQIGGHRK